MQNKLFTFDPSKYAAAFSSEGYVHIHNGTSEEFYKKMITQVDEYMKTKLMKEFAIGDKQQAMYEFPPDADYVGELFEKIGKVTGLNPKQLVLSERHIKAYESSAEAEPHAHKDRFASELSVGISVHVKEGSTLVLYPYDQNEVNPFNASTILRGSLSPDRYPEPTLKKARRVEIKDKAGDVIVFRGHKIWHLRANPANTTMLYLKINSLNCDPLGEDPKTPVLRKNTLQAISLTDGQLENYIPLIGRRVDYIHRHYNRDWTEVLGVVLWGEKHFSIDDDEMRMMKAMDGKRTVGAALAASNTNTNSAESLKKIRRLATRGVIDLMPPDKN
jgi:hypothetical protein